MPKKKNITYYIAKKKWDKKHPGKKQWEARISYYDPDQLKWRVKPEALNIEATEENRKEAMDKAKELRDKVLVNLKIKEKNILPQSEDMPDVTMIQVFDDWLEMQRMRVTSGAVLGLGIHEKSGTIRPNTYQDIYNHSMPVHQYIEQHPTTIKRISTHYIDQLIKAMNREQIKDVAKFKRLTMLKRVLNYAVTMGYRSTNPMDSMKLPSKARSEEPGWYNPEQIKDLFQLIDAEDVHFKTLVWLCAYLGIRRQEAMAFTWDSIDFKQDTITVDHVLTEYKRKAFEEILSRLEPSEYEIIRPGLLYEHHTKSKQGLRRLAMHPALKKYLLQLKEQQDRDREYFGNTYKNSKFIIRSAQGDYISPAWMSRRFSKFIQKKGLPKITLHGLRHSMEANLEHAGVVSTARAALIGDKVETLTHYDHHDHEQQRAAGMLIGDLYNT